MKHIEITVNGVTYHVETESTGDHHKVVVDGVHYDVTTKLINSGNEIPDFDQSGTPVVATPVAAPKKQVVSSGSGGVIAPMPGNITSIKVAVGDSVENGTIVAEMEAMKMITPLPAPRAGLVKAINMQVGDNVDQGAVLIELG